MLKKVMWKLFKYPKTYGAERELWLVYISDKERRKVRGKIYQ